MNFAPGSGNKQWSDFTAQERLKCRKEVLDQIDKERAEAGNPGIGWGCENQLIAAELADLDAQMNDLWAHWEAQRAVTRYTFLLVSKLDCSYVSSFTVTAVDAENGARAFATAMNWQAADLRDVFLHAGKLGFTLWIHLAEESCTA